MQKVEIQGWKGKDEVEIVPHSEGYLLTEHRKNKETGDVYDSEHVVSKEYVDAMARIMLRCAKNMEYKYKWLVRAIIEEWGIHTLEGKTLDDMTESFNGGKHRAKHYFPKYYWPLKVLEAKGVVGYLGRGGFIVK